MENLHSINILGICRAVGVRPHKYWRPSLVLYAVRGICTSSLLKYKCPFLAPGRQSGKRKFNEGCADVEVQTLSGRKRQIKASCGTVFDALEDFLSE
jgi:hypothetical protein